MIAGKYESCIRQSEFSEKQLLRDEFCSQWWITASFVRRRDEHGRILVCRKRGAYPVGSMIKCLACGKWAPADPCDTSCVDCRVESDQARFLLRVRKWPKEDRPDLFRVHWRRPMPIGHWLAEGMPRPITDIDYDLSIPDEPADDDSPANEADTFGGVLEPDQTWGSAPSFHEMLNQLWGRFTERYRTKNGETQERVKRHGAGCKKRMLSESEAGLMKEIAYYQARGKIVPSARRLNDPIDRHEKPLPMPGQEGGLWL